MDKLTKYRQVIKDILFKYNQDNFEKSHIETQIICDESNDHYQVINLGWEKKKWVHYCLIHIDIKNEKIWIQWNMTEEDIAQEFVNMGIPKKDIVIGFHPPQMRKLTDYAIG